MIIQYMNTLTLRKRKEEYVEYSTTAQTHINQMRGIK